MNTLCLLLFFGERIFFSDFKTYFSYFVTDVKLSRGYEAHRYFDAVVSSFCSAICSLQEHVYRVILPRPIY